MSKECRTIELDLDDVELRTEGESENEQRFVQGIGIVYDKEVEIYPGFREKIRAGAFESTLSSTAEIKSFFNHDPSQVLATTKSKPKLLLEDSRAGLRFKAPIPPTTYGNDLKVNLERKNVRGASFSFSVDNDGDIITRDEKGVYHREIVKATIYEIGPVTNPAYRQTQVGLRSAEDVYKDALAVFSASDEESQRAVNKNKLELEKQKLNLLEGSI